MRSFSIFVVSVIVFAGLISLADAKPRGKKRVRKTGQAAVAVTKQNAAQVSTEGQGKLVQATYAVADLIVPIDYWPRSENQLPPAEKTTMETRLTDLIVNTVAPQTWDSAGGCGHIEYYPLGMALVVTQTQDAHEQIRDLLCTLRRLQDPQVVLEVRLVSLTDALWDRVCAHIAPETNAAPLILEAEQVKRLLEQWQRDPVFNVMQFPKVTAFNGQHVRFAITDQQSIITDFEVVKQDDQVVVRPKTEEVTLGVSMSAQPVVAPDRASVRLALNINLANLAGATRVIPITTHLKRTTKDGEEREVPVQQFMQQPTVHRRTVEQKLAIPVQHTAVLDAGFASHEVRHESGTPVLADLPYVGRLFRCVGYGQESRRTLILVTATIIDASEVEIGKPASLHTQTRLP